MKKILELKKSDAPLFLTLLIAALLYQLNSSVGYVVDTPTLSQKCQQTTITENKDSNEIRIECLIKNVSHTRQLTGVTIYQTYNTDLPDPKVFYSPDIITIAPSMPRSDEDIETIDHINSFNLGTIQPMSSYTLVTSAKISKKIKVLPKLLIDSSSSVRLVKSNFFTWMVEKHKTIGFVLIAIWAGLILVYLKYLGVKPHE